MIGIEHEGKKLMSLFLASVNLEDHLSFRFIKIEDGPDIQSNYSILPKETCSVNSKAPGTLVIDYLLPGRNLYLIATGTGLASYGNHKIPEHMNVLTKLCLSPQCSMKMNWHTKMN